MFNIFIIITQFVWNYVLYFFLISLIFQITLLSILSFFVYFFGKKFLYKYYLYTFYILFILSIIISICGRSLSTLTIINDFSQNYIILKNFPFSFIFNYLTLSFSCTTIQIAFFVNIFTILYCIDEQKFIKFFLLLNFFVFSMIFLLHTNNFVILFFFWECIGITSYFLINFFELKSIVFKSAFKAFSFNRISDVGILIALIIYYNTTGSFELSDTNFSLFFSKNLYFEYTFFKISNLNIFLFFLCLAICCKSAQFGLHFWLPDSMEAPAPASALIHSATLVSAGLFLVLRFLPLFKFSMFFSYSLILIGSITCLFGSLVSCTQTDIKRLLAYSTIGNCGLLIYSAVTSSIDITILFFQLHGFFKSLSFLFIGYLIIKYNHLQDLRYIGNLYTIEKILLLLLIISLSFLSAWFFSVGNVVKHIIMFPDISSNFIFIINAILFCCTLVAIFYSLRLMTTIFNYNKFFKNTVLANNNVSLLILVFFIFILFISFFTSIDSQNLYYFTNNSYFYFKYLTVFVLITTIQYCLVNLSCSNKIKYSIYFFIFFL